MIWIPWVNLVIIVGLMRDSVGDWRASPNYQNRHTNSQQKQTNQQHTTQHDTCTYTHQIACERRRVHVRMLPLTHTLSLLQEKEKYRQQQQNKKKTLPPSSWTSLCVYICCCMESAIELHRIVESIIVVIAIIIGSVRISRVNWHMRWDWCWLII